MNSSHFFNQPLKDKNPRVKTNIKTRVEFLQPIDKAFYLKEKNNKYYLTDGESFTHKLSYKTALNWLNI